MSSLTTRNKRTDKAEAIRQRDLTKTDWGFHFFVDGELEAYKAAYLYRYNRYGVKVEFAGGIQQWMVTVFNDKAADYGIDGAQRAA